MKKSSITQKLSVVAIFASIASAGFINHAQAAIIPFRLPDSFLQQQDQGNDQSDKANSTKIKNNGNGKKDSSNDNAKGSSDTQGSDSTDTTPPLQSTNNTPDPIPVATVTPDPTPIPVVEKAKQSPTVVVAPEKPKAKIVAVATPAPTPRIAVVAPEFTKLLLNAPGSSYGYKNNGLSNSEKNRLYMLGLALGISGLALALYEKLKSAETVNTFNSNF